MKKYSKPVFFKLLASLESVLKFSDSYCYGGESK